MRLMRSTYQKKPQMHTRFIDDVVGTQIEPGLHAQLQGSDPLIVIKG